MTDQASEASSTHSLLRITAVLFLVALVAGFAQFGAVASLNDVANHFGHVVTNGSLKSEVGLSGSILGLGLIAVRLSSLAALPLASLADRWGRTGILQRTLIVGLAVTSLASLSPTYWFFVLCFAIARPLLTTASTLVQVVTVELSSTSGRIQRLVIMAAGAGIGAGLSAILHGLIRGSDSFRWLFAIAVIPLIVVLPLLHWIPEPTFRAKNLPLLAHLGVVPHGVRGRLAIVCTMSFTVAMVTGPANGFAFRYAEGILKFSPHVVALVVALSAFTGLAGLLVSRRLARTIGRRWTVAIGAFALAATSTFAYSGGKVNFIVGYMVGIAAAGVFSPAASAISTEIFAHTFRATAAGWTVVAGVIGGVVGLALFGVIADAAHVSAVTSWRMAALITFLPLMPTLILLRRLPESKLSEIV